MCPPEPFGTTQSPYKGLYVCSQHTKYDPADDRIRKPITGERNNGVDIKHQAHNTAGLILPLLTGLFIYLTCGTRTYLSDAFSRIDVPHIDYPEVLINYGCDALWGFALFNGLSLFEEPKNKNIKVLIKAAVLIITLESVQLFEFIPGTFHPIDILTETIAVFTAMLITTIPGRLFQNEKRT